jgi:hypothetical protein
MGNSVSYSFEILILFISSGLLNGKFITEDPRKIKGRKQEGEKVRSVAILNF